MSHLIIIGSGVAGLTAALEAVEFADITLVSKSELGESNTRYAQGGVAVVMTAEDSVASHVQDTLRAGAGLSDRGAVEILCAEGPIAIHDLMSFGVEFDRRDGQLSQGLEAAHSHARVLHAGGDATGAGIADALIDRLRKTKARILEGTTVTDLLMEEGRVVGVQLLDGGELRGDAVVLATGGAGQLFPYTTNPEVATADGLAMALRAGAAVADLEFYQFHPTSLAAPGNFLVSEAVRGEGAVLIDQFGERFMFEVHPDGELAPRDVVARGIAEQMAKQPGIPVRLDATALGAEFLARRFPNIDAACRAQGFEWGTEPIPVTPAAHYYMGGIRTDSWGRTSLPGLFAVGEVACNGLHGANRLASNSLLEGAVYGRRVAQAILEGREPEEFDSSWSGAQEIDLSDGPDARGFSRDDLQQLMWSAAGLSRNAEDLARADAELRSWQTPEVSDVKSSEDANLLLVARAVVAAALAREESRGAHFRTDHAGPTLEPVGSAAGSILTSPAHSTLIARESLLHRRRVTLAPPASHSGRVA